MGWAKHSRLLVLKKCKFLSNIKDFLFLWWGIYWGCFRKDKNKLTLFVKKRQRKTYIMSINDLHKSINNNNNKFIVLTIITMRRFSMPSKCRRKNNKIIGIPIINNNNITGTIIDKLIINIINIIRFLKIEPAYKIILISTSIREIIILMKINSFYLNRAISSLKWISKAIPWILICDVILIQVFIRSSILNIDLW